MEARREVKTGHPDVSEGDPKAGPGVDVVLEPPRNARVEYTEPTRLTNTGWGSTAVVRTLERIYAAVRPSRLVQQLLKLI